MSRLGYAKPPYDPTRFPKGITNANINETLGMLGKPDPTKFASIFEDFLQANTSLGTSTPIAGPNGLATVATTVSIATATAVFGLDPKKRYFFKARLSLAAVANGITVGFADSLAAPTQGTVLTIANNVMTLQNFGGTAAVVSKALAVPIVNATMFTLGFAYAPNKHITAYVNDEAVGRITGITALTASNLIAGLRPNGTTATVDYLFACVER